MHIVLRYNKLYTTLHCIHVSPRNPMTNQLTQCAPSTANSSSALQYIETHRSIYPWLQYTIHMEGFSASMHSNNATNDPLCSQKKITERVSREWVHMHSIALVVSNGITKSYKKRSEATKHFYLI